MYVKLADEKEALRNCSCGTVAAVAASAFVVDGTS